MITQYDILRRLIISEKADILKKRQRKVTLQVMLSANKYQIRNAIEALFPIRILAINTSIFRGKRKRVGKTVGLRSKWKKAVLTFVQNSNLEVFNIAINQK